MQQKATWVDVVNEEPAGDGWAGAATLWLAERALWAMAREERAPAQTIEEELRGLGKTFPRPGITFVQLAAGTRRDWTWRSVELVLLPDESCPSCLTGSLHITITVAIAHWWLRGLDTAEDPLLVEQCVATDLTPEERAGLLARITAYLLSCRTARLAAEGTLPGRTGSVLPTAETQPVRLPSISTSSTAAQRLRQAADEEAVSSNADPGTSATDEPQPPDRMV